MDDRPIQTAEAFEAFVSTTSSPIGSSSCSIQGEARELDPQGHGFDLLLPMTKDDQSRMMSGRSGADFGRVRVYSPTPRTGLADRLVTTVTGVLRYSVPFDLQIEVRGTRTIQGSTPGRVTAWQHSQLQQFRSGTSSTRLSPRDDGALRQAVARGRTILWIGRPGVRAFDDFLHGIPGRFRDHVRTSDAAMQGPRALPTIIQALDSADPGRDALVVISRGGGDPAALATFHDAALLEAAARCEVPVASAIGHARDEFELDRIANYSAPTPGGLGKQIAGALFTPPGRSGAVAAAIPSGQAEIRDLRSQIEALKDENTDLQSQVERLTDQRDALDHDAIAARIQDAHDAAGERILGEHRVAGALLAVLGLPLLLFIATTGWARSLVGEGGLILSIFLTAAAAVALLFGASRCLDQPTLTAPSAPQDLLRAYRTAHTVWRFNSIAASHLARTPLLQRSRRWPTARGGSRAEQTRRRMNHR